MTRMSCYGRPEKMGEDEMSLTPLAHQIPRGLAVDEVIELGTNTNRQMEVFEDENLR